jgi:hypothetical protein
MCYLLHDCCAVVEDSPLIRLSFHRITIFAIAALAAASSAALAGPTTGADSSTTTATPAVFDHSTWDRLLATYVDNEGRVAYRTLQAQDKPLLQSYLDALAAADPSTWPPADQIAFWLNAYNAGIWSGVLQGKSGESLESRGPFFKAWMFKVAGQNRTLDEIENEILRRKFTEPRIHFALVCAAMSCPRLQRQAYRGATLNAQLDAQAKRFINDPERNVIDPSRPKVQISMIFVWFKEDFMRATGTVEKYIAPYVENPAAREFLLSGKSPTQHLPYDWTLNAQPEQRPWVEMKGPQKP